MCSTAVGTRSGISGLPEPEPELSGTRNVGFHFVRANFGFHFSKPEFPKTRITRPEIFGLPDCPALPTGDKGSLGGDRPVHAGAKDTGPYGGMWELRTRVPRFDAAAHLPHWIRQIERPPSRACTAYATTRRQRERLSAGEGPRPPESR
jgi:hypothetical protein